MAYPSASGGRGPGCHVAVGSHEQPPARADPREVKELGVGGDRVQAEHDMRGGYLCDPGDAAEMVCTVATGDDQDVRAEQVGHRES